MASYVLAKSIAAFFITLMPLVFIHELGHYWVARMFGVHVDSFSIGFGPKILGWKDRRGTMWQLSAFPLGGYVKIAQEDTQVSGGVPDQALQGPGPQDQAAHPNLNLHSALLRPIHPKRGLASQPPLARILIALGGPISNYILAFCLLIPALIWIGQPRTAPILAQPPQGSVAAAYFQKEDRILTLNEKPVASMEDVRAQLAKLRPAEGDLTFTVARTPETSTLDQAGQPESADQVHAKDTLDPTNPNASLPFFNPLPIHIGAQDLPADILSRKTASWNEALTGLSVSANALALRTYEPLGAGKAVRTAGELMNPITPLKSLSLKTMGGPVNIAQQAGTALTAGWKTMLFFMAMMSIALGFFNLMPLPGLDGGMVVLTLIEAVRGRPLSERAQSVVATIALATLISLFVLLTWQDLMRLPLIAGLFAKAAS